jgi:activator of HSP90 ATPase
MKNIDQETMINATSKNVYNALMDERIHATFTGATAKIDNKVGGSFEVWDGYASGKNIELVLGKKIVQSWHANDWPDTGESLLTIDLMADGDSTKLTLSQKDVPDKFADEVEQGWKDFYWKPLNKYFEERKK